MVAHPDRFTNSSKNQTTFQELESREGELHLRFYISSNQEFALPATGIREVISATIDRITPIPNVSPLILGTLNLRGRVLWVVDLSEFLGEEASLDTEQPEIPVIAVEEQDMMLGLAVNQIVGMEWLDVEEIQPVTQLSERMGSFVRGEWVLDEYTHQCLRLLNHKVMLQSTHWST